MHAGPQRGNWHLPLDPPTCQNFGDYAVALWLPNHVVEASTRQAYSYQLHAHLLPWFGHTPIAQIQRLEIRRWVAHCVSTGLTPATIRHLKTLLSAVLTGAMLDGLIPFNPCHGVRTPFAAPPPIRILTPEQFNSILAALAHPIAQLLAETAICTGLRWSELTELRAGDLDQASRIVTISRVVVELASQFHPCGERFLIKHHTKNGSRRHQIKIGIELADLLNQHIAERHLDPDELIFHMDMLTSPRRRPQSSAEPSQMIADLQDRYQHGTMSAYNAGKCRCQDCRDACAAYRRRRRSNGHDRPPRLRPLRPTGHISGKWFRTAFWTPALGQAGITFLVRLHDLRHAHASWLLAGGGTVQDVKERLNQASLQAAERYLHNLPDTEDDIVDAFERIRFRTTNKLKPNQPACGCPHSEPPPKRRGRRPRRRMFYI